MTMGDAGNLRVFFALLPSHAERASLAAWQIRLCEICGGRKMRVDTLHTTLVFVGGIEPNRLETLKWVAQQVKGESFDLAFDKAHYWRHKHIVYAAPNSVPPQLTRLVKDLEHNLTQHHFQFDRREYKPHVTLLRHAFWGEALLPDMERAVWQVKNFVLLHSTPGGGGAHYSELASFKLH
jgi:2'-5' RNA ligase